MNRLLRSTTKSVWRPGLDIVQVRQHTARMEARLVRGAPTVPTEPVSIDGIPATWFGGPERAETGTLLYLHGGAWCLHLPRIFARFASILSDLTGMRALAGVSPRSRAPVPPKGFDDVTQTTIVDASGRIVLQVYGEDFAPPSVVEPLKRLVWGREVTRPSVASLIDRVKLVCTIYDPASGLYRFDYSLIMEIVAGALALGIAAAGNLAALRNVR